MIKHSCEDDRQRWAVSASTVAPGKILVCLDNDTLAEQSCRIRMSPEEARDMAMTLLHFAQDIEKPNEEILGK